jgi:GTP-binding protein
MKHINIAIIAHVDHGKTTLVDALLKQSWAFRENEKVDICVMDSNDQEKERGITSIFYKGTKINIVDTPGHADFGSEVERALRMVDSVCLVVDAYEGPMPQTKFVLKKALALGIKPIVVINKIDKPTSRPDYVINALFDLFVQLGATDEQLDFPICYAIAREGIAKLNLTDDSKTIIPLFDLICEKVEIAEQDATKPLKMQVSNLAYDNFLGRMWVGRIFSGTVKVGQQVVVFSNKWETRKGKISEILTNEWLNKVKVKEWVAGDIVHIAGIPDIYIGETVAQDESVIPLAPIVVTEPTLKMEFLVNNSPFAGRDGKYVTSRHIRDRLEKELEVNVGLKINFDEGENYMVAGRGELHLSVLIETMRREGYELQVGSPEVIMKIENGVKTEPIERVNVNVPSEFAGSVIEKLGKRRGEMQDMMEEHGLTNIEFLVPTRGLLGFKNEFTTITKGEGILTSSFEKYDAYKWEIEKRQVGSMIAGEGGIAMAYSLWKLQERGPIFINPGTELYGGMIIGEHLKWGELVVNATKNKQLTNVRASGTDEALNLTPIRKFTLEDALDYIGRDEYVEITPNFVRIRKKYLDENERKRYGKS